MYQNDYYSFYNNSFSQPKFTDVYPDLETFKTDYRASGLNVSDFTDASIQTLYYLLYASYGNSHIASSDTTQFKYKLYSIIFSEGLQWQQKVAIQKKLATASETEVLNGGYIISNSAANDANLSNDPLDTNDILNHIDEQTVDKTSKDYVDAYQKLVYSLRDVSSYFVEKFRKLFAKFVGNNDIKPLYEGGLGYE